MRDRRLLPLAVALVLATIANSGVQAQGLGYVAPAHTFDLEVIASADPTNGGALVSNLGCAWFQGRYYFSTSANGAAFNHRIISFDTNGNYVGGWDQDSSVLLTGSQWGYRDGATDAVYTNDGTATLLMPETVMFWGNELGIYVHDATGALATTYNSANGVQPLPANPIPNTQGIIGNLRAIAYDPHGNAGNGSMWCADFGSAIVEIDMSGTLLTQIPFVIPGQTNQWSAYGMAIDPYTGQMWVNASPNLGKITQLDKVGGTFAETGHKIDIVGDTVGGTQGGLDTMVNNGVYPSPTGNAADLVGVWQGGPDVLSAYRLHLYAGLLGETENRLVTQVTTTDPCLGPVAGPRDSSPKAFAAGDGLTWGWDTTNNPGLVGAPAMVIMGIDSSVLGLTDASTEASTLGGIIPEFTIPNALSAPVGLSPFVVGDGLATGTLLGTPVPIWAGTIGAADLGPIAIGLGGGFGATAGDNIAMQALAFDPASPSFNVVATNRTMLNGQGAVGISNIICEAVGANSFNADTTNGYWRVRHTGTMAPIVQIDVTLPAGGVWDTDQGGMADLFWGGNSALVGTCGGTYRNGSDVACGLIYDNANTYGPTSTSGLTVGCDATANCGFIGGPAASTTNNYSTLTFRFNPNQYTCLTFEWDADTDGLATPGSAHAGTVFNITLQDGTVLNGTLVADPNDVNRASLIF